MNIADELAKLNDLHKAGAITDQEFEAAKQQIITSNEYLNHPTANEKNAMPNPKMSRQPLRIIFTVFSCMAACAALVYALLIPIKLIGVTWECRAPISEGFVSKIENPLYEPNHRSTGSDQIDSWYTNKRRTNPCFDTARDRLLISGTTLVVSFGSVFLMWRNPKRSSIARIFRRIQQRYRPNSQAEVRKLF